MNQKETDELTSRNQRTELGRSFIAITITALITLLGAVLPMSDGQVSPELVFFVGYSVIAIAAIGLIVQLGSSRLADYRASVEERRSDESITASVPTHIRLRNRHDVLRVDSRGHAILEWTFDVERSNEHRWSTLSFPVRWEKPLVSDAGMTDSDELGDAQLPVRLISVFVDGVDLTNSAALTLAEYGSSTTPDRRFGGTPQMSRFCDSKISVPVRLAEGRTRTKVEIKLVYDNVDFSGEDPQSFLAVEVPYLTDKLHVEIRHDDPASSIAPPVSSTGDMGEKPIVASSMVLGLIDSWETQIESDNLMAEEGRLVWKTRSPKLSYRYRVNFRVVAPEAPRLQLSPEAIINHYPVD